MMFVIKAVVTTVLLVMVLQIEVGGTKLETRAENWVATSFVTRQLRQVAGGAIKASKDLWKKSLRWAGLDSNVTAGKKDWAVEFRHKKSRDANSEE
jgi:hypothetical protein